jgi:hypothetical protein
MSKNKLYIIGNGFDIYHGIKSSYSDFKEFIKINDIKLFRILEEFFYFEEYGLTLRRI